MPGTDAANVIFDMSTWAQDFAGRRAKQAQTEAMQSEIEELEEDLEDQVNTLMESKGCAIMDSGGDRDVFINRGRRRNPDAALSTK